MPSSSHRLTTEWSTDSPILAKTLKLIAEFPENSPERLELEGQLHLAQARLDFQRAAILRQSQREAQARRRKRPISKN